MADSHSEPTDQARKRGAELELDALIATARAAEPPVLNRLDARRMVRSAITDTALRAERSQRRLRYAFLCAAAALLLCVGGYTHSYLRGGTEVMVAADSLPLRLSLTTGDTLVLAPASKLEVLSEKIALRRVRLAHGSALFDVAKQNPTHGFIVVTPHAEVRVRGTVFTVQVSAERSVVHVHEGSVWVGQTMLAAGDTWTSDGRSLASDRILERTLAADIRTALAARSPQPSEPVDHLGAKALPTISTVQPATRATAPAEMPEAPPASLKVPRALPAVLPADRSAPDADLDHHQLRELLRRGQTQEVIARARRRALDDDAIMLLLADALRAQSSFDEALSYYEALAERTRGPLRAQAGFAAAQIALVAQRDPARALRSIEGFALDREGSALSERASFLHVDALLRLGRSREARELATRYLASQPETEASARMRSILEDAGVSAP